LCNFIIEFSFTGGQNYQHQILATTSLAVPGNQNQTNELKTRNDKARTKTVENLWLITEGLNILYKENWTILAAQEITR